MTPAEKIVYVTPGTTGDQILERLARANVNQVPVLDGGKVVGIVCRNNLLQVLQLRTELGI
jgi:CBS domain-containing protein